MQAFKAASAFLISAILMIAAIEAIDTFVLHHLEPDFGGAFGNFSTVLGIYAALSVPAALTHGAAAFLLRKPLSRVQARGIPIASALSALGFLVLFYFLASVNIDLPLRPLVLPCVASLAISLLVFAVAGLIARSRPLGAA